MSSIKYKPCTCYQCGGNLLACRFNDIWDLRIDNVQYAVPLYSVPCMYCESCNISLTDDGSDEVIGYWRKKFMDDHGLNTPYLRFRRWVRSEIWAWQIWHWNKSPWARFTWPADTCPDRVKNRRWWQWR
jgi:hypothetical protein